MSVESKDVLVVIDAGHGGFDPGAVSNKKDVLEKEVTLDIALKLKKKLEAEGFKVLLTRYSDEFVELHHRAALANKANADIFVSIHNNSFHNPNAKGFETFIYQGKTSSNTKLLQNCIHDRVIKDGNYVDRGKKVANFAVLRLTKMPAILVEYLFISNDNEVKLLNDQDKLDEVAGSISKGILEYLELKL